MPSIAVIMRSKDEMPYLERALNMLDRQTQSAFDLFAVDSGSSDGSLECLRQRCPSGQLKEISPRDYAPGKVLNSAIEQTTHDIIVLLNADAVPCSDDWLEKLTSPLLRGDADALFCRQKPRPDARFIVAYDYARAYNASTMQPGFFSAVACAFRREVWEQTPFRAFGYAEDVDWAEHILKTGRIIDYLDEVAVEHSHNYSLNALFRKRYRQALTFDRTPSFSRQMGRCFREMVRDLLYALRRFRPHTIPYNLLYRAVIHRGEYVGLKDGATARAAAKG